MSSFKAKPADASTYSFQGLNGKLFDFVSEDIFMKINFAICGLLLGLAGSLHALADESPATTLDALHTAGAEANQTAFFSLLTDGIVFLGMEGSDRLVGQSVRDFFSNSFSGGESWALQSRQREIQLSADGKVAWFDELLQSDQLGLGRGSGVLIHDGMGWKLAQYNVTLAKPDARQVATAVANPEERVIQGSAAVSAPAASTTANTGQMETQPKKTCRKFRHKTNKKASC